MKKVFLETLQNSLENTCARVSFITKLEALGLNFAKLLRTPFLTQHLWWLLLVIVWLWLRGLPKSLIGTVSFYSIFSINVHKKLQLFYLENTRTESLNFIFQFDFCVAFSSTSHIKLSSQKIS